MSLDLQGNWQPGAFQDVPFPPQMSSGSVTIGSGAPDINTAVTTFYIDSATGKIYTNPTLTAGAWTLAGGSAGVAQIITKNEANPITAGYTPTDPSKGALYFQDPAITPYNYWSWSVSGQTWIQVSSPS